MLYTQLGSQGHNANREFLEKLSFVDFSQKCYIFIFYNDTVFVDFFAYKKKKIGRTDGTQA